MRAQQATPSIVAAVRRRLRDRPIVVSSLATALAALAVLAIARVSGADAVGRAFDNVRPGWIALIAGAELLAYPAYMLTYRSLACVHGHAPLALPLVARVVIAGFGPFATGGGYGIDRPGVGSISAASTLACVNQVTPGFAKLAPGRRRRRLKYLLAPPIPYRGDNCQIGALG